MLDPITYADIRDMTPFYVIFGEKAPQSSPLPFTSHAVRISVAIRNGTSHAVWINVAIKDWHLAVKGAIGTRIYLEVLDVHFPLLHYPTITYTGSVPSHFSLPPYFLPAWPT